MNKLAIVLGAAAVAVLAGCKDPKYINKKGRVQNEAKPVATEPVLTPDVKPVSGETPYVLTATADPLSVSTVPALTYDTVDTTVGGTTGVVAGPDGVTTVKVGGAAVAAGTVVNAGTIGTAGAASGVATTTYIIQRGDLISKISKRYNISQKAILAANPGLDPNKIRIGQKIQLPGTVDVGEQKVPEGAFAKPPKKVYVPYTGATKDYVIKKGDTLGGIAYSNGILVRQLKEMNGLTSDFIREKQVIKIPAEKVVATPAKPVTAEVKPAAPVAPVAPKTEKAEKAADTIAVPVKAAGDIVADGVETVTTTVESVGAGAGVVYEVQDGEDITGLAIRFSMDPSEIRSMNNLGENDEIKAGQKIRLPADVQL